MCFRLLAAVQHPATVETATALKELQAWGERQGLDVRVASSGGAKFVELAWGDCACSLVTRGDGKRRVSSWVQGLLEQEAKVELLLFQDGDALDWEGEAATCALTQLQSKGLAALEERRVTKITPS